MDLIVIIPDTYQAERGYILSVILKEFLGLHYIIQTTGRADVCISDKNKSRQLIISDRLFAVPSVQWLTQESLPKQPLEVWNPRSIGLGNALEFPPVPIIYGARNLRFDGVNSHGTIYSQNSKKFYLPIDIFGSAFFILTRYEEIVKPERDQHDRFPATASLAYQEGFLDRPIIDEYVELLWAAMKRLWPGLQRKERSFTMVLSHDVDAPSRYALRTPAQILINVGADVVKRRKFRALFIGLKAWHQGDIAIDREDPYNCFDWLMSISESHGLKSAFYFISGWTDMYRKPNYDIGMVAIRRLLRRIHCCGHEIGLHPSFNTYKSPVLLASEAARLRQVCREEGIHREVWGGRMHWLRWEWPTTLYGWETAGMTYDSTLGFHDVAGFRCGTCHEYPAFDLVARRSLLLRLRPLIAMDGSIIDKQYMGMGIGELAYASFKKLKGACRIVNGNFTLAWHNSKLASSKEKALYLAVLQA